MHPPLVLNLRQKQLLLRSWKDDFTTLFDVGTRIYEEIFSQDPTIFFLFPKLSQYSSTDWKESKEFKRQALTFVQILARAIHCLDCMEDLLDPVLYKIGKMHTRLVNKGFKPAYWDTFEKAVGAAMKRQIDHHSDLTDVECVDAVLAWQMLAAYIIRRMKEGFEEQKHTLAHIQNFAIDDCICIRE